MVLCDFDKICTAGTRYVMDRRVWSARDQISSFAYKALIHTHAHHRPEKKHNGGTSCEGCKPGEGADVSGHTVKGGALHSKQQTSNILSKLIQDSSPR